jgi:tetratricopeptide (TPR) repeat protein
MRKLLNLLVVLAFMAPQGSMASNPAFAQAVQKYKLRQYSAALVDFQTVLRANPRDPTTHYYMALCYQAMNQVALARQQYEWVASSNDATLRGYASSGLAQLQKFPSSYTGAITPSSPSVGVRSGAAPRINGRLKVIEFYTDW